MRRGFQWLCTLACALLFASSAFAQSSTTSLRGTVRDPSQAVVPGVQVKLANAASGLTRQVTTDGSGGYVFAALPPGTYTVTASLTGFASQVQTVTLLVSQPATLNFQLTVGKATQSVEVSAITETLNTTDATIGNAVGNLTIQALPMEGRNVPDLLSLQPGVVYLGRQNTNALTGGSTDSRNGAVGGVRSDQSNLTLDGVSNNDEVNGYAFAGVLHSTLDSVEEFRVVTTNSDASSGGTGGAQVIMVTKSGTNQWHGSLYEYNRNTGTSANDWFNKQSEIASGLPNKPGQLNRNTFGGSLGGPILKNKLFFFVNAEEQKTAENQEVSNTVPTASFRNGNLGYTGANGQTVSLDPAEVASMDPNCSAQGTCSWGAGVDPNVLKYLQQYPEPNGFNSGDGINTASFSWSAPNPITLHTYVARIDWQASGSHHLFVRGNLQHDSQLSPPSFPGQPPSSTGTDDSGGLAVGDTWTVSPTKVNNLRYGYIVQKEGTIGSQTAPYVSLSGISPLQSETATDILHVPMHNLVDDFTWTKGSHTLQFGANYLYVSNETESNGTSFASASTGVGNIYAVQISGGGGSLDPAAFGYEPVSRAFQNSYDNDATDIAGLITNVTEQNNYRVAGQGATLLPPNGLIGRNFRSQQLEWYVQDAWRMLPNLTITFGVRQSLQQAPYEVNGQQVGPTTSLWNWFETRGAQAQLGNSVQPLLSFAPSGKANGGQPFWPMPKADFAPRVAVAFSPSAASGWAHALFGSPGTSSIRGGVGMYYDHFGQGIATGLSQYGSFGLTSSISSPLNVWTVDNAPRFTAVGDLPYNRIGVTPPAQESYPYTPSADALGTGFSFSGLGVDDHMKTPYSIAVDTSIERQLPGGFTLELDYVGNFGHNLLQQLDVAEPLDLVDPKSGMDYFTAARLLSEAALANHENKHAPVQSIPYWENLFPSSAVNGMSATQNIYTNGWYNRPGREVGAPYHLDVLCDWNVNLPANCGNPSRFWDTQFSSLFTYASIGNSNYNAAQIVLHHPTSHGLQLDFNFTYGRSFDLGSDAERANVQNGNSSSQILNSWDPELNYAPSDYDTPIIISADWVYELPFGRGRAFGSGSGGWLNALIGGWQFSGLARGSSGFPFSILDGTGYSDNYLVQNYMVKTGPVPTHKHTNASGGKQVFADPGALQSGIFYASYPLRVSFAGEPGSRNAFRGDGLFDIDSGLSKKWTIHEAQTLKFAWETFNVTNSVRFNTNSLQTESTSGSLGVYGAILTPPRVMQFSLRYSF